MMMKKILLVSIMIVFMSLLGSCSNQDELKQEFILKMDALNDLDNGKLTGDIQAYTYSSYNLPDNYKHRDIDEYANTRITATLLSDEANNYYELNSDAGFQHSLLVFTEVDDRQVEFLTINGYTSALFLDTLTDTDSSDKQIPDNSSILSYDYIWNDDVKITKMAEDSYQLTMNPDSFNQMAGTTFQDLTGYDLEKSSKVDITVTMTFVENGLTMIMQTNMFQYALTENNEKYTQFKFSEQLVIPQGEITMKTPSECINRLIASETSENLIPYQVQPNENDSYIYKFVFSSEHDNFGKIYLTKGTFEMLCWYFTVDGTPSIYTEDMTEITPTNGNIYEIPEDGYYIFELQVTQSDQGVLYFSPPEA